MQNKKTFDAVYFGGHYKDPRAVMLWLKCTIFLSAFIGAIILPLLFMTI